jgi:hypothetical protein
MIYNKKIPVQSFKRIFMAENPKAIISLVPVILDPDTSAVLQ